MKLVDFIKAFDLLKAKSGNESIKDWIVLTSDFNSDGEISESDWEAHCEWRKPETKDGRTTLIPTEKDDLITWSAIAALEEDVADEAPTRAWSDLRSERDAKLLQSDWRASGDLTISDEWKAYRKALRDLPSTLNDTTVLEPITWPEEPS